MDYREFRQAFRFRLSTLLWVTVFFAMAVGYWVQVRRAHRAVAGVEERIKAIKESHRLEIERLQSYSLRVQSARAKAARQRAEIIHQKYPARSTEAGFHGRLRCSSFEPTVPNLQFLGLLGYPFQVSPTRTNLTGPEIDALRQTDQLRGLYFSNQSITIAELSSLRHARQIERMNLNNCGINDQMLAVIATMAQLKSLQLSHNPSITDDGIRELRWLPNLLELEIHATNLTDACTEHIAELKNLRRLRVDQTQITGRGRSKIKQKLPSCRIVLQHVGRLRIDW